MARHRQRAARRGQPRRAGAVRRAGGGRPRAGGAHRQRRRPLHLPPAPAPGRRRGHPAGGLRPAPVGGGLRLQGRMPQRLRLPATARLPGRCAAAAGHQLPGARLRQPAPPGDGPPGPADARLARPQPGRPGDHPGRADRLRRRPAALPAGCHRQRGLPAHRTQAQQPAPPRAAGRLPPARGLQRPRLAAPGGQRRALPAAGRGALLHPRAGRAAAHPRRLAGGAPGADRRAAGVRADARGDPARGAQPAVLPHLERRALLPAGRRHGGDPARPPARPRGRRRTGAAGGVRSAHR
ncbi:hypothetical protein D9M70_285190 [compost metagenome]